MQVFTEEGQGSPVLTGSAATGSHGLRRINTKARGTAGSLGYVLSAGRLSTSGFREHSAAEREGANARLELATSVTPARHWLAQLSYTLLDARYRDAFSCSVNVNLCPAGLVPAGKRIPGTARSALAAEIGWRPPTGWRAETMC